MSDQSEATPSRESARRRREVSPLRSEEVTSTTASPEREDQPQQVPAASTPLSPSTSWESSPFSSSDWFTSSAESSAQQTPHNAERRRQAARNLSQEFAEVSTPKSARLERGEGLVMFPEVSSTITTGTTPPSETEGSDSRERLVAASSPSYAIPSLLSPLRTSSPVDSSSPVRRAAEEPGYVALQQSSRTLDVTTDSENCPLLRSSDTIEEISIGDEPATNQGGRNLLDAGDTEACPRGEPLDARSATGVTSQPQLVAKRQIATAAVHPPDSFPLNPPTHPVNPALLGLSIQNTQSMVPTEPWVYQRIDERQTAGETWGWPIAGAMNAATESPIHFSSLPFTSQPLNQSSNPVVAGLPTSIRQVTDPWTPYSYQFSGPQQNISLLVTTNVGSATSEMARTDPTGRTMYQDGNFLYQGNSDPLPLNPTVVTASTSSTQTRAPTSSVEMSMLSNLSDFRTFPRVQTGLSNKTGTVNSTGNNKDEAGSTLTESSGGVASVQYSQSYVPHWWPSYITISFSRVTGEQPREMPLDLTPASTSRRQSGFPPLPQCSQFSDSVHIPSAAPQLIAPRPPPAFTPTVGTPLHVPQPVRHPLAFAVTRHTNAANIIRSQPPGIQPPDANQITMPSAPSGCTIEHDVQPTVHPSTVSTAPPSVSPEPASDPAVRCCSSDTGDDERTHTE